MQNVEYAARIEDVKRRAHGRWTEILGSLGVGEHILKKRNQPCPMCGGTDRFQYTDRFGEGNYHCRGCGAGGGFKLLQAVTGLDFNSALNEVERCVGGSLPMRHVSLSEPSAASMKALVKRIWEEALPVTPGDVVDRYLSSRGLSLPSYPKVLRMHPCLGYYEKDGGKSRKVAEYPAMLACVQGADGDAVTLHRTYLKDGRKADVPDAKKVLSAGISGAAIRLFEAHQELALTEGIETGFAVHLATGKPVWSGISAGNLEKLWLPETLQSICVYTDNDADGQFDGQFFGFALARRLKRERKHQPDLQIRVFTPKTPGTDWADVWLSRLHDTSQAH